MEIENNKIRLKIITRCEALNSIEKLLNEVEDLGNFGLLYIAGMH